MLIAEIVRKILGRVGGLGSDIADAQSIYTLSDRDRQRQLEHQQAIGTLGLTSEELAALREQGVAPVQGAQREQNAARSARYELGDADFGQAADAQIAAEDVQNRQLNQASRPIAEAQALAAEKQRQDILGYKRAKDLKDAAIVKAIFSNLLTDKQGDSDFMQNIGGQIQGQGDASKVYGEQMGGASSSAASAPSAAGAGAGGGEWMQSISGWGG